MVSLRRATADDISFIMATDRVPGYDGLGGCFGEGAHRPAGAGTESLRRFAGANAGRGFGKPFLAALIDWIFTHSENARCHLHVRSGNDRARHVYTALGFEDVGPEDGDHGSRTMVLTKAAWCRTGSV